MNQGEGKWPRIWVWRDQITGKIHTTTGGTELAVHPPVEAMRPASETYAPLAAVRELEEALEEIERALTAWDADEPFQDPGERHDEPYEADAQFVTFMGYTARNALKSYREKAR